MKKITRKQIAVVQMARKQLGLDDAMYWSVLFHYGGGALSSRDLTPDGFASVMDWFNKCGFRSGWIQRTYGNRPGMASPKQIDLIRALWREWSGSDNEAALGHWLEKSYGISSLRFLPSGKSGKAITGLRTMIQRRKGKRQQKAPEAVLQPESYLQT